MTTSGPTAWPFPGRLLARPRRTARPAETAVPAVTPLVRVAVYLYVLSIPFEIPHRAIPIEVPTLTGGLLILATLVQPTRCFRWIPGAVLAFGAYLIVFVVAAVLSAADYRPDVLRLFIQMTHLILLLWVLYNVLGDTRVLRGVLIAIVVAGGVRAAMQVLGIATTVNPLWGGGERLSALGQNANLSAMILSGALVTTLGLSSNRATGLPRLGVLGLPIAGIIVVAIVQTGSRGGVLCALTGAAALSFRGRTLRARLRNGALAVVALAGIGALTWGSPVMRGRFEGAVAGQLAGREAIYPVALDLVRERPLLGWGPIRNQFEIADRIRYPRPRRDVHNLVLEVFTTTGFVGAVPFLLGMGLALGAGWRARRGPLGALPAAFALAVLVGTIGGTWIAAKIVWFALALCAAAGAHWSRPAVAPVGRA